MEIATLAGGCFWCVEAVYDELDGVLTVESGYMGGTTENPTYEAVCTGATGHAEVVQLSFDPAVIGYDDILNVFFSIHDPTQLNRQGNDVGAQYRSAIFYHNAAQQQAAEAAVARAQAAWDHPIVTKLESAAPFYKAEAYHEDYFARNPAQPYCAAVVAPKVAKFRKLYTSRLKRK